MKKDISLLHKYSNIVCSLYKILIIIELVFVVTSYLISLIFSNEWLTYSFSILKVIMFYIIIAFLPLFTSSLFIYSYCKSKKKFKLVFSFIFAFISFLSSFIIAWLASAVVKILFNKPLPFLEYVCYFLIVFLIFAIPSILYIYLLYQENRNNKIY